MKQQPLPKSISTHFPRILTGSKEGLCGLILSLQPLSGKRAWSRAKKISQTSEKNCKKTSTNCKGNGKNKKRLSDYCKNIVLSKTSSKPNLTKPNEKSSWIKRPN